MKDARTTGRPERAGRAPPGLRALLEFYGFDPPRRVPPSGGWEKARLEALSDGVFAVALTLLIVDLATASFPSCFADPKWQEFLRRIGAWIYILAIIGTYWVAHHNEMRYIAKADRMMLWINLSFLCLVVLLPASAVMTALYWAVDNEKVFGERLGAVLDRLPAAVHGVNLGLAGLALDWLWRHAKKHRLLARMNPEEVLRIQKRNKLIPGLSFLIAFLGGLYPRCALLFPLVPATYIALSIGYARDVARRRAAAIADLEEFQGR